VIRPCARINPPNENEAQQQTIRDRRKDEKKIQKSGAETSKFFFHEVDGTPEHAVRSVQTFYILGLT
jgi:hypothetical protein